MDEVRRMYVLFCTPDVSARSDSRASKLNITLHRHTPLIAAPLLFWEPASTLSFCGGTGPIVQLYPGRGQLSLSQGNELWRW